MLIAQLQCRNQVSAAFNINFLQTCFPATFTCYHRLQRAVRRRSEEVQENSCRRSTQRTVPGAQPRPQQPFQPRPGLTLSSLTVHICVFMYTWHQSHVFYVKQPYVFRLIEHSSPVFQWRLQSSLALVCVCSLSALVFTRRVLLCFWFHDSASLVLWLQHCSAAFTFQALMSLSTATGQTVVCDCNLITTQLKENIKTANCESTQGKQMLLLMLVCTWWFNLHNNSFPFSAFS